jgi:hypothetical protein
MEPVPPGRPRKVSDTVSNVTPGTRSLFFSSSGRRRRKGEEEEDR